MAYCKICGDEQDLRGPVRFWSPDDGWMVGRLCRYCAETELKRRPRASDYAYDQRGDYVSDADATMSAIYG